MESLSDTTWDIVICGTGLRQSLLALALSRSGKKVLHIDRNNYYGGTEAAFSLQDAATWINDSQSRSHPASAIEPVSLWTDSHSHKLSASRSYTLTLSPHLIYSQSALLPALVSSQLHTQLDFQAVGPWWIYKDGTPAVIEHDVVDAEIEREDAHLIHDRRINGLLQKIPSNREDVFADDTLSPRDKRSLMKFLRSVLSESILEVEQIQDVPLSVTLSTQFKVARSIHQPLLALSLSYDSTDFVKTSSAVSRIRRHMRSIGALGPGFGAVMPKYGGGAEIAQVACRASAVGGAVYVLGRDLRKIRKIDKRPEYEQTSTTDLAHLELSDGEEIKARFVAGCAEDFPEDVLPGISTHSDGDLVKMAHTINIVSSPLEHLFPPTSENGPIPAGAVVVNTGDDHGNTSPHDAVSGNTPTYMIIHSSDSGECPSGQCVVYASTSSHPSDHDHQDIERLNTAVSRLLTATPLPDPLPELLWSMTYHSRGRPIHVPAGPVLSPAMSDKVIVFPPPSVDLAFDDSILDGVREMWKRIMGDEVEEAEFLRFGERGVGDEDEEA